jgi:hypothetical protein
VCSAASESLRGVQRVYEIRSFIWWGFGTRSERHSPSWTKLIANARYYQNVKMVSESVIVLGNIYRIVRHCTAFPLRLLSQYGPLSHFTNSQLHGIPIS